MNIKTSLALIASAAVLSGCGSVNSMLNETTQTHEFFRIYDVKTSADVDDLGDALEAGMKYNLNNPQIHRPFVMAPVPKEPGRFTTDDTMTNTNLGRLMKTYGQTDLGLKTMVCKDSPWQARGTRFSSGDWNGVVNVCVFPYQGGYHVDMYGFLTVKQGGIKEVVRSGVYSVMGEPLQWIEKAMLDTIREARAKLDAEVSLVEARPKLYGTPWLMDPGADVPTKETAKQK